MLVGLLITRVGLGSCQRVWHTRTHARTRTQKSSLRRLSRPFRKYHFAKSRQLMEPQAHQTCESRSTLPPELIWSHLESFHKIDEKCLRQVNVHGLAWNEKHGAKMHQFVHVKGGRFEMCHVPEVARRTFQPSFCRQPSRSHAARAPWRRRHAVMVERRSGDTQ